MKRQLLSPFQILTIALQDGGITYNPSNGELNPQEGFAVSLDGHERTVTTLTEHDIISFVNDNKEHLSPTLYLGIWKDGDKWVLDLTVVARTVDMGIKIGRKNNQKCIYNLQTKELVYLLAEG